MAIINFISSDKEYKDSAEKVRVISKLRLAKESRLYITLDTRRRGERGLRRFHEMTEIFISSDNRVFAGFIANDRSGQSYCYTVIGRFHILK